MSGEHHPWAVEFARRLEAEPGGRRRARVFVRLCEAFGDPHGLPTLSGLQRLESGALDDRLPAAWRPVYADVYRRWIGHRLERELARGPRPLSLRWWISPLTSLREHLPAAVAPLTAPVLPLVLAAACAAVLAVPTLVGNRARIRAIEERLAAVEADRLELARRTDALRDVVGLQEEGDVRDATRAWPAHRAALDAERRSIEALRAAVGSVAP